MAVRHLRTILFPAFSLLATGPLRAQSDALTSDVKKDYRSIRDYFCPSRGKNARRKLRV